MHTPRFHFEGEGFTSEYVTNWENVHQQLSFLDPYKRSYIILTLSNQSYVQCAGSKYGLVVEARIYTSVEEYIHYRFGKGSLTGEQVTIACNVGPIFVDKSQVLTIEDAARIMHYFIETGNLHTDYAATQVTEKFENQ